MRRPPYFAIAAPYVRRLVCGWGLPVLLGFGIMCSLLTRWNDAEAALYFAGIELRAFSIPRNQTQAVNDIFLEFFSVFWLGSLALLTRSVFIPLSRSSSVSQTLWLRLTPALSSDLALARSWTVLITAAWVGLLGLTWALAHMALHAARPAMLLLPVTGLMGHVLLAGGIITLAQPAPTSPSSARSSIALLGVVTPIALYLLGRSVAPSLGGFFPYASPFVVERIRSAALRPFLTAGLIGLTLLLAHVALSAGRAKIVTVLQARVES